MWWLWANDWWQTLDSLVDMLSPLRQSIDMIQRDRMCLSTKPSPPHLCCLPVSLAGVQLVIPLMPQLLETVGKFAPGEVRESNAIISKAGLFFFVFFKVTSQAGLLPETRKIDLKSWTIGSHI